MLILAYRADLRGLPVETIEVRSDQAVPEQGDIYLLGGGEDGPQALAAAAAQRRPRPAPGGRARRHRARRSAPATNSSAPPSSPRAPSTPGSACSTSAPTAGRPGPSASSPVRPTRRSACRTVTGFENHGGRTHLGPGARAAGPGHHRDRQRRHDRGRLVREDPRHLHARAGAGPQPGPRRPAAALGHRLHAGHRSTTPGPTDSAPNASPPSAADPGPPPVPGPPRSASGRTSRSAAGRPRTGRRCTG